MNDFTELDELPFDVPDELGEMVDFHNECPGVYYIALITKMSAVPLPVSITNAL